MRKFVDFLKMFCNKCLAVTNNNALIRFLLFIPLVIILIVSALHYLPFLADDSLISLRYAQRFLNGDGLTWNNGQPVEGYSNLLWILLVSFLGKLGVDLIVATRILGILGMLFILFSIQYWYLHKYQLRVILLPLLVGQFFLSVATPISVWAIGGLEQPLYGALISISIIFMLFIIESNKINKKYYSYLSISLGLLCITRPDGPIFTVVSIAFLFILSLINKKKSSMFYLF